MSPFVVEATSLASHRAVQKDAGAAQAGLLSAAGCQERMIKGNQPNSESNDEHG
jgi:hypothetical protein